MRDIEIEMPSPGGFACCPSGDTDYEVSRAKAINDAVPDGYELVGHVKDVKTEHRTKVEHFAVIKVRQTEWNGIPAKDRTLWFGIATEGMKAPWMGPFGSCVVKIWDIRRRDDGVVEYGIGNETRPPDDKMGWFTGDKFYSAWSK